VGSTILSGDNCTKKASLLRKAFLVSFFSLILL